MAFILTKRSKTGDMGDVGPRRVPEAPGASWSPQIPGEVPDRSGVPGEGVLPVAVPETPPRRPITEYGTAQRIMRVYAPKDGNEDDPARFEQAPISYEEQRKAYPALRTPMRPLPGYQLAEGTHAASTALPSGTDSDVTTESE